MNKYILLILVWVTSFIWVRAQTLGEAVHGIFGKTKQEIIARLGTDYHTGADGSGNPYLSYQVTFIQQGQLVAGYSGFFFKNEKVFKYITSIVGSENYSYWVNEFETKLIQRRNQSWIEPEYDLVWLLELKDNIVFITGIDNAVILSEASSKQSWGKEIEIEFMKNCVYGNPQKLGIEVQLQTVCRCVFNRIKQFYQSADPELATFSPNDMLKFAKGCNR